MTATQRDAPRTDRPFMDRWPWSDIGRKSESPRYSEPSTNPFRLPIAPQHVLRRACRA